MGRPTNTVKTFMSKVHKTRSCWLWTGARDKDGYGLFSIANRLVRAHRYAAQHYGLSVANKLVCHKCDNPSCVRPSHLFIGTVQSNTADRDNKGRQAKGETCHLSVLTDRDVRMIVRLGKLHTTHRKIAEQFGISRPQVSAILRGDCWKHIER